MKRNFFIVIKRAHLVLFFLCLLLIGSFSVYLSDAKRVIQPVAPKLQRNTLIFIDLTEHKLYLIKDNNIIKSYPIASGTYETPSPIGDWKIISKGDWGEGFGGSWLGINVPWGNYGIHGTSMPGSIGGRTSHGCIRMFNRHARELSRLVKHNTPVKIYGGPYGPFGMGFRTLHPGDRGSDVYEVQVRLKRLGHFKVNPNGIYGDATKRAIFEFQKKHKMPLSNYVDKRFYEKLNIILFE